jgi:hypothetical protein
MNNNQVHPDNFVGEKIKTFLIGKSLNRHQQHNLIRKFFYITF